MSDLGGLPWISGVDKWRRLLVAELGTLPDTLRLFREGVDNFQRITKRLLDATQALEQVAELSQIYTAGMTEGRRRLEEAGRALGAQAGSVAPGDPIRTVVEDVGKALSAMAELNPLWRRGPGHGEEPPTTG